MRRTGLLIALSLLTAAAAAIAAIRVSRLGSDASNTSAPPTSAPAMLAASSTGGPLRITAQLARRWLDPRASAQYLEVDVFADGVAQRSPKTAVNAVFIIDRSGSMAGEKIERARDAARTLISALDGEDRLAIVDFGTDANVLFPSSAMTPAAKQRALDRVATLEPTDSTNLSAAIDLAAPQLREGHSRARVDKIFLASDGQVNTGIVDRRQLEQLMASRLEGATVSTFGLGADYDEDLMTALAVQSGGRARLIENASELPPAIQTDLSATMGAVARQVHLSVKGLSGASVASVIGFDALADGSVRLGDFFAGERRRVLIKLSLPGGSGETRLAQIALACDDVHGAKFRTQTEVGGEYTADARLLQSEPNDAAIHGAQAEMAERAQQATQAQARGDVQAIDRAQQQIAAIATELRTAKPGAAPIAAASMQSWMGLLSAGKSGSPVAMKKAKQQATDETLDCDF